MTCVAAETSVSSERFLQLRAQAMPDRVTLEFPDGAFSALRRSPEEFAEELKRAAVCKWYELGVISQGKAAELLQVSRARFVAVLSSYRVSPFQETPEELRAELERG